MDDRERRARLADAPVGHLATVTAGGEPHVVPCCFAVRGDTVYTAVDAKPKSTRALRRLSNVEVNPVASLVVDRYDDDWTQLWWVRVDGAARIVGGDDEKADAVSLLRAKYEQYGMVAIDGPVIAIDVTRWRSWSYV
jgi:PPOX class probable F420-dependent enzyme